MSNDKIFTVENLYEPEYFDKESLIGIASPWKLHCITYGGRRTYWAYDKNDEPIFYNGASSFVKRVLPPAIAGQKYLTEWAVEMFQNKDHYKMFLNVSSIYGSFLHWQIKKYIENGKIFRLELENDLAEYLHDNGLNHSLYYYKWLEDCKRDLLSFRTFVRTYNVRIHAVEFPIAGTWGVATRIDLVCTLDLPLKKNGEPYAVYPKDMSKVTNWLRDVPAIGDIKSKLYSTNRGIFYPPHAFQLYAYRRLWNDSYSKLGLNIDFIFNWSPSDNGESFNFKPWTSISKISDNGVFSFEDKSCNPGMLDDLIDFHMKWLKNKIYSFTRIYFEELNLYGESDADYSIQELMRIAKSHPHPKFK